MKPKEWDYLDEGQKQILESHLSDYPVKVGQLAEELGVKVKISDLQTGVSGQITREDGSYVIRVNRYEARERQRFTIAHELAHFLLHKDIINTSPDGIRDNVLYRSGAPDHIEYEANRLAAEIIMPVSLVKEALNEKFNGEATEETTESLAEQFCVSKVAMEIRLENLS